MIEMSCILKSYRNFFFSIRYDLVFFYIGFTLLDSYRII
jgi:hypothetical protein